MAKLIESNNQIDWTQKNADMVMNVGKRCSYDNCGIVDMLPFECKYCKEFFCLEHRTTFTHKCKKEIDSKLLPLDAKNIKQKPIYIRCEISKCCNLIENKVTSIMLSKCNKCQTIRCSMCRTEKKCCK